MRSLSMETWATTLLVSGLVVAPTTAIASSSKVFAPHSTSPRIASSPCDKVSAAQVSAVVGYKVPNGIVNVTVNRATKADFETSWVTTTCVYGSQTSVAAAKSAVQLVVGTFSKPFTLTQMERWTAAKATSSNGMKLSVYRGLGVPAFYSSLTVHGIFGQSITAVVGPRFFGAFVETKMASRSEIAELAKLADRL